MKKNKKIIALLSAIVFSVLFSILFKWAQTGHPFQPDTILYGTIFLLNIIVLGSIANKLFHRYSKWSSVEFRKHIVRTLVLFIFLALVFSLLLVSAGVYVYYLVMGFDTSVYLSNLIHLELTGAIKQFSIWILIGSAVSFYLIWRKAIAREQELKMENLKYRYRNLKSQVNPHFLFNSLNTLSEIVYQDPKKADAYIQKLSGIYRYILDHEETDLVPLEEELEFVRKYFELQKERDQETIRLDMEMPGADEYRVIPVSLQILVENALKHNTRSGESPLEIQVRGGEDCIVVSNPLRTRNHLQESPRTGLANLQERVRLLLEKDLDISEENDMFVVKLPVIRAEA